MGRTTKNIKRMRFIQLLAIVCLASTGVVAQMQSQQTERALGQVLVQLAPNVGVEYPSEICRRRDKIDLRWERTLAADWNMHLYSFDEQIVSLQTVLALLNREAQVIAAQGNFATYDRAEPNDAEYFRQTNMTLIKAPQAWDITTGGVTAQGDTIVAAILEKGYYRDHPDYQANRWYNRGEIPDNGIDDDGNGYRDDFRGYDPRNQGDGFGNQSNHGTSVTGIVGAQGNNSIGVAGVNWNIKLMNISNVDFENEIIDAYYYVHKMRELYNQTNGSVGAFVVASNASFGIDKEKAEDHQLWCAVYDSLGKVGVLSIGATTNTNSNVDMVGDMPTTCTSPYLMTVTNVNSSDVKQSAGFGQVSIDMAAPGTGVVTTGYSGSTVVYSTLGGTSSSAPHVTGAVALLYSLKCELLTADALTQPTATAERFRDLIFNHLDDNPTLLNITKYEGRLNLFKPMLAAQDAWCTQTFGDLTLNLAFINTSSLFAYSGTVPDNTTYAFRVHNSLGQLMYEKSISNSTGAFGEANIDTRNWGTGVYVASITKGKKVSSKKFLKF
jgi:hypothetical protein